MKRRCLSLVLALALAIMVLPMMVKVAGSDFMIVGGVPDVDYFYDWDGVLTINTDTALTISGTTTTDKIVVAGGITASIALDGVNIDLTSTGDCAFDMAGSAVNLTLAGNNVLKSGGDYRAPVSFGRGSYRQRLRQPRRNRRQLRRRYWRRQQHERR